MKTRTKPETRRVNVTFLASFESEFELEIPKEATPRDIVGLAKKFVNEQYNSLTNNLHGIAIDVDGEPIQAMWMPKY
jgi:hypothetical protein